MDLAAHVEHTMLKATAAPDDVVRLCGEAMDHGLRGVCVSPHYVTRAAECLQGSLVRLITVVGFPLGTHKPSIKAREAREAVEDGAGEIDMVGATGLAVCGDWDAVRYDIDAVRRAIPNATLKVILETGYFDDVAITHYAEAAIAAGADYLKTSTGFGPRGATVEDVALLVRVAGGRAAVKAAGGIRTRAQAHAMIEAGATRIGTSEGVAIACATS